MTLTWAEERAVMKEKTGSMKKYDQRRRRLFVIGSEQGKVVRAKDEGKIGAKVQEANT